MRSTQKQLVDSALYSFIFDVLADRDSRIKAPEMVGITWKIDRKPNVFAFSISLDEFDDIVGRIAHPMRWYAPFQRGIVIILFS